MSIRRINSTGRKKIKRQDVQFFVQPGEDGVLTFDAKINLHSYRLPADAQVFVEAQRKMTRMRFAHGTVSSIRPESSKRLTEFAEREGIQFYVKVTAAENAGMLLAVADQIPVTDDQEQPQNRKALLPPMPADLNQELWQVDLSQPNGPMLLINRRVGDWKAFAASPIFRSLVYPAAMRQILWHIYKIEEVNDLEDTSTWASNWLSFSSSLPGVEQPPLSSNDDEDWGEWISSAVSAFARQHEMLNKAVTYIEMESS